jgi:membrane protease YdiL (CAAX protease family)
MCCPLNLFPQFLAAAAATVGSGNLSEGELIARYPALATAVTVLLSLGLIGDWYLLRRFARPAFASGQALNKPLLKIEPKPWSLHDVWFVTGVLVLVLGVVELIATLAVKLARVDEGVALPWLLGMDMLLRLAVLFGFVELFRRRRIDWSEAFGLRREPPLHALGLGAVFFVAVLPPLAVVFTVYAKLCHLVGIKDVPQPISDLLCTSDSVMVVALIVVFAIVVAPVCEELFFRGFAYPALKQRWGTWAALTTASAAFAVIHLHLPSLGPLFALAVGLGLSYELTGSLLAPITMHALFNATNVAVLLYVRTHS